MKVALFFGRKAVVDLTGVSGRQADHWANTGVVRPSLRSAAGKGTRREYSFKDLVALKVAKRLRDEGVSLQKIRKALLCLRRNFPEVKAPLAELRLVTDGRTLFLVDRDPSRIMNVLQGGQFVFSLALGEIIEELQGELRQFATPTEEKVRVAGQIFTVVLTPDLESDAFTIHCREIPGAISEGATEQEALDTIYEVLAEHLGQGQETKAEAGKAE
jgi:DNA-binding transcriptional MerR regulator